MSLHPGYFRLPLTFHAPVGMSDLKVNPLRRIVSAEMEIGGMEKECGCESSYSRGRRVVRIEDSCGDPDCSICTWGADDDSDDANYGYTSRLSSHAHFPFDQGPTCERCLSSFHKVCATWKISSVSDGSLPDEGFELNLAPAGGDHWIKQVKALCGELKERRAWVDSSCGLHTHADARDVTWFDLRRVILYYAIVEPALYSLMPSSRRNNNYCVPCGTSLAHPILASRGSLHETKVQVINTLYRFDVDGWRKLDPQTRQRMSVAAQNGVPELVDRFGDRIQWDVVHESMREVIRRFPNENFGDYWNPDDHWSVNDSQRHRRTQAREMLAREAAAPKKTKQIKPKGVDPLRGMKRDTAAGWQRLKGERYANSRYNSLNVHSWVHRRSLEWRMPPGSVQAEKVIGWGQLMAEMINAAVGMSEKELMTLYTTGPLTPSKRWEFLKDSLKISRPFAEVRRARYGRGASEEE